MVPLDYIDPALAWQKRQPGIDSKSPVIVSSSKGAEAALLIATRHPELRGIVVDAPFAAV